MSYQFKHLNKGSTVGSGNYVFRQYSEQVTPQEEYFLTFSSPNSFTLSIVNNQKYWDGTLETSTDKINWTTWSGTSAVSSASDGTNHNIYVRGIGNTYITGSSASSSIGAWRLNGSDISVGGNIENLLDYATVENGNHPPMAFYCYAYMFYECSNIISVSNDLVPATTLTDSCYRNMFNRCSKLTNIPTLPATTLSNHCYRSMFHSCSSLIILPKLPATTLAMYCYYAMFNNCSLIKLSPTQTGEYVNEYRIPTSGTGTTSTNSLTNMLNNTGGTFTGTPAINTTYYTSNEVV